VIATQGRTRAAAAARPNSLAISAATKVAAMTANYTSNGRAGSMNCGRKAAMSSKACGLLSANSRPSRNSKAPDREASTAGASATSSAGARQIWMPSRTS
jgi:hypothetical protein